jgi:hypothetical protein
MADMGDRQIIIPGSELDLAKLAASLKDGKRVDPWLDVIAQAAATANPTTELSAEFLNAVTALPMKAADLWATVMENSVRTATIDFSWKDPLDPTGKQVFSDRHDISAGFLDGGQALADRIADVGRRVAGTKILTADNGRQALEEFTRLVKETAEFLEKNPGKGEGASWKFDIMTPFDARAARIAEVDLPDARTFLTKLFNDMMKIIETVDINLSKPKYGDNHQQFVQGAMARIFQPETSTIAVATTLPGASPA